MTYFQDASPTHRADQFKAYLDGYRRQIGDIDELTALALENAWLHGHRSGHHAGWTQANVMIRSFPLRPLKLPTETTP